jgi:acetyl esterase/lipase
LSQTPPALSLSKKINIIKMEDPLPILKMMLPRVPLIGKTVAFHALGLSETSKQWDLKTELIVNVIRSFLIFPSSNPVSKTQHISLKDPGIKGKMWISKVTLPVPEEDSIRQSLFKAIEAMKEPDSPSGGYHEPELKPVEAEWTGYRSGATKKSPRLRISEEEQYAELMKEVTAPTTILYFHGGAYYLMDPASHRPTVTKLAKLTKGRCLSVRYRLAPQNPFPAALLDALVAYFTLLYPLPGSYHTPVAPEHIVFAGDSAGGNLCTALMHTLLEFRRQNLNIRWNGEDREVPLPAGLALNSPWMDITHSSPSCETNANWDYLPALSSESTGNEYPPCPIWPANPPRRNMYAEDAVLRHPLVSPIVAKNWEGCPPIYIVMGQELLADEGKYVSMVAARQGVQVVFDEFEAMPHTFALILEGHEGGRLCFTKWAAFINACVTDPKNVKTVGHKIKVKTLQETELDMLTLSPFTAEEVASRMKKMVPEMSPKHTDTLSKL